MHNELEALKKNNTWTLVPLPKVKGNNSSDILKVKKYLQEQFDIKELGTLKYFLGIKIAHSMKGLFLCQRKYVLDLLKETSKLAAKPVKTPIETTAKLNTEEGTPLHDISMYQRLVDKLIYLTVTRPGITFEVSNVSQFLHAPRTSHLSVVYRILHYLKAALGVGIWMKRNNCIDIIGYTDAYWACNFDRKSTTDFCTFVGGNLVMWRSKKQKTVSRSNVKAEYRVMAATNGELIWIKYILTNLGVELKTIKMYCNNNAARYIASNLVFHERTKQIELKLIVTLFVRRFNLVRLKPPLYLAKINLLIFSRRL
ncbi:uncharacterized mitochondrial protein AtMg00810-like [Impatiens glandulifera]|uniref:uncharacterized mitochondrial protein AtMg00810-like n=1 Tax=Impatiens glandulifera TaxID=253017 RepID=UPI001FB08C2C|nr:uncharacterized mitochondrial protein AtMg00810-like [Impatiens glandulifera]